MIPTFEGSAGTVEVGDKVVMIPISGGGSVAVKSGDISIGDKVVMIPIGGGSYASAKIASPSVGDKVVLYPIDGGRFACLVSDPTGVVVEGNVVCWGDNSYNQGDVPDGLFATYIGAGLRYNLALKADGSVVAWGDNLYGQCDVPAGLVATSISAGVYHNLALKSDGSISAWGRNSLGQCNVPDGLTATQISAGLDHSIALKPDGSVVAWGDNTWGQCNVPSGLVATLVWSGYYHNLAIDLDGFVVAWGDNYYGQCNVPAGLKAEQLAPGGYSSYVVQSDGTVVSWGRDTITGLNALQIGVGASHGLAVLSDHSVFGWGSNSSGQTTIPDGIKSIQVDAEGSHSICIVVNLVDLVWSNIVYPGLETMQIRFGGISEYVFEDSAETPPGESGESCKHLGMKPLASSDAYVLARGTCTQGGYSRMTGWIGINKTYTPDGSRSNYASLKITEDYGSSTWTPQVFVEEADLPGGAGEIVWRHFDIPINHNNPGDPMDEFVLRIERGAYPVTPSYTGWVDVYYYGIKLYK